jgi:hypothetical protein
MKCFVFGLFVADTTNSVFDVVYVYNALVVHFGRFSFHICSLDRYFNAMLPYRWYDRPHVFKLGCVFSALWYTTAVNNSPVQYLPQIQPWLYVPKMAYHVLFHLNLFDHQGIIAAVVQLFFAWRVKVVTGNIWAVSLIVAMSVTASRKSYFSSLFLNSCAQLHVIHFYSRRNRDGYRMRHNTWVRWIRQVQSHCHHLVNSVSLNSWIENPHLINHDHHPLGSSLLPLQMSLLQLHSLSTWYVGSWHAINTDNHHYWTVQ